MFQRIVAEDILPAAILGFIFLLFLGMADPGHCARRLKLATTTSTENSGLLLALLPPFVKKTGTRVDVISVGTGKALKLGSRCDVDLVMVHSPALEKKFVEDGFGVDRRPFMHNFFVLAGPPGDPAGINEIPTIAGALGRIAQAKAAFVSRGDNSGTHLKELDLWKAVGIKPGWPGYLEVGQGMGRTLTMAAELGAYTLSDNGTFLKSQSVGKINLAVLVSNRSSLKNSYAVIMVNPQRCKKTNSGGARALMDYLVSREGQRAIQNYRVEGKQLFWPDVVTNP